MSTDVPQLISADEALATGEPLLELRAHALSAIAALVPASVHVFLTMSRRLALQDGVVLQSEPLGVTPRELWHVYAALVRPHDSFASERVAARGVVVGLQDVEISARYDAFLREAGVGDCMTMYLRVSGKVLGGIWLARSTEQPPFTRRETVTLRRMQPLMQHAYAAAVAPIADGMRDVLRDSGLSAREADVAELVGRGATNLEIARTLHVSEATVKTHLSHIYAKVGVNSRTQLAILVGSNTVPV
jgi:DNA-binding CsgD family transcriptional regulator